VQLEKTHANILGVRDTPVASELSMVKTGRDFFTSGSLLSQV
jgi:hypothetical protein